MKKEKKERCGKDDEQRAKEGKEDGGNRENNLEKVFHVNNFKVTR